MRSIAMPWASGPRLYLRGRYEAAIEQAKLNIGKTDGAYFSYVTLVAAYAQLNRSEDAASAATMLHRVDPAFDPRSFGNKFLHPADLERLREGFRKAGVYPSRPDPLPRTTGR